MLQYNYYRDYDPATGRYVESDPIGLRGGWNTFGYALQSPIEYGDPTGQVLPIVIACAADPALCAAVITATGIVAYEIGQYLADWYSQRGSPANQAMSSVGPSNITDLFPTTEATGESCSTDDFCSKNRNRLLIERNFLIDARATAGELIQTDLETRTAMRNEIDRFNKEVREHNRMCGFAYRVPRIIDRQLFPPLFP